MLHFETMRDLTNCSDSLSEELLALFMLLFIPTSATWSWNFFEVRPLCTIPHRAGLKMNPILCEIV